MQKSSSAAVHLRCPARRPEHSSKAPEAANYSSAKVLIDVASNGRYVRNVLSEATTKMKSRNATDPTIDLTTADLDTIRTIDADDMRAAIQEVLTANGPPPPRP